MSHLLPSFFNPTDGGNPPPPPSSPAPSQMDSTTPPSTSPVTSDKSSSVQHPSSVDTSKSSSSGTGNGGINVSGGTGTTGGTGTGTGTGAGSAGGDANSGSTGSAAGTGENGGLVNEPTTTTSPVPAPAPPETVPTSTASMTTSVVSPTTTSALPTSTTSAAHSSSTTSAAQPTTTSSAAPVPTTVVVTTMPEPTATALPPPPSPPSGSGSGSNIGVIIGAIAGGICGVIVLIWLILIPIRKAQRKKKEVEWLTFGTENDHVNGSESTADVVRGGRPAADMDNSTTFAKDISSTTPDMYQMNSISNTGGASTLLYSHLDGNGSSPWVGPPPVPHPPSVGPDGSVLSGHDTTGYPYYEYDAQGYPPYYSASATGAQAGMQVGGIVGGAAVAGYVSPNASSPEQHPQRIRGFGTGPPASIRTSPVVQPTRYQGSMHPSNSMGSMSYSQLSHGNNAYSNASQMSMGQGGGGGALQQPMPTASTGLPQSDTAAVSRNASSSATSTAVAVPAYSAQGLRRTASGSSIHRLDDDKSGGEDHEVMQREQVQAAVHQGSSSGEAGDNSAYDGLAVTYDQHGEPSHGDTRIDPPRQPHGEAPGQTISYRRGQGQIRQRHAQGQDQSQGQEQGQQVARDRESLHEGTIDVSMTDQKHDFRITNDS